MGVIPRVYLHDASLQRIGQLTTTRDVNRSFRLDGANVADVSVAVTEPLMAECNPQRGRVLVVESDQYPFPWVGKITIARRSRADGTLVLQAKGFDTILEQRLLGARVVVSGTPDVCFRSTLAAVNGDDGTGIGPGAIAGGSPLTVNFSRQSGRVALDAIASLSGNEWWLEYTVANDGIGIRANMAPWRGFDRFTEVSLVDAGNCTWKDWNADGEAATFSLTVLGGSSSPVTAVSDRAAGRASLSLTAIRAPHGYSVDGLPGQSPALTRADRLEVADVVRSAGLAREAAEVALARQVGINGVPQQIGVVADDRAPWELLDLGSIIHLVAPDALFDGFDGPARIRGVMPLEEDGECELVLQLLRPRL